MGGASYPLGSTAGARYHPRPMTPAELDAVRAANRARFARLVARPEPEIDLARGALAIASDGRPDSIRDASLAVLDDLAERVRARFDLGDRPDERLDRLHDVLYREAGFRAPRAAEWGDADDSRLDRVLERRVGLPISLALVELEVAARVGIPAWGIGLPGHFIVGAPGRRLIDPADGGRSLTPDDCQALVRRALGERVLFHAGMLRPANRREILARMLRNLRSVHLAARDWPAALGIVDLLSVRRADRPRPRP